MQLNLVYVIELKYIFSKIQFNSIHYCTSNPSILPVCKQNNIDKLKLMM